MIKAYYHRFKGNDISLEVTEEEFILSGDRSIYVVDLYATFDDVNNYGELFNLNKIERAVISDIDIVNSSLSKKTLEDISSYVERLIYDVDIEEECHDEHDDL